MRDKMDHSHLSVQDKNNQAFTPFLLGTYCEQSGKSKQQKRRIPGQAVGAHKVTEETKPARSHPLQSFDWDVE